MKPNLYPSTALVSATKPYLWIFTTFAVAMPPCFIVPNGLSTYRNLLLYLIHVVFIAYVLMQLLANIWITYVNNIAIAVFVNIHSTDSITCVLGIGINVVQLIVQIGIYIQALTGYRSLRQIFINIVQLEWDIRQHGKHDEWSTSSSSSTSPIRWRLFLRVGLWLNISCIFVTYLSYELSNTALSVFERIATVLLCAIIQVKGVEYCIYVQFVQELLHLVKQQLRHLRRELLRCECLEIRSILYAELRTNQQLLARVWNLLNQVEGYFCIPMLMLFFYNGFAITQAIHWAYINFELDDFNLRLLLHILLTCSYKMKPKMFPTSALVSATKPYLWIFTSVAIAMPPCFILPANKSSYRNWILSILHPFFIAYVLAQLIANIYIAYINNKSVAGFVISDTTFDITLILSIGINTVQLIVQIGVYIQALTGYRFLRQMFIDIVHLECEIRQHDKHNEWPKSLKSSIHWRLFLRVGLWFLISFILVTYLSYVIGDVSLGIFDRVATVFVYAITQVKGIEYCIYVQLVHELLHMVKQELLHLRRELLRCECLELRSILYAELRTNQQLLARLWNLLNQVEGYFCIPMLMLFFYNGFAMTQTIHWAYINFERDDFHLRLCRIIYTVMVIVTLFVPCYLSQCCIDEYNQFGTMLHKLKVVGIDSTLSMRLQEYSLQLMHQQMLFTCGGFFDVNLKNFGAIILTITTYVVILIQFKLQAETEKKTAVRYE